MFRISTEKESFLRYFFNSYIPPYMRELPCDAKVFNDIYLSANEVWINFQYNMDDYSISYSLKKRMIEMFKLCEDLWLSYLASGESAYKLWVCSSEVKARWREIQSCASGVFDLARGYRYL